MLFSEDISAEFVVVSTKTLRINNGWSSASSNNTVLLLGYSQAEESESLVLAKWSLVHNHLINWQINITH